ncbi:MAG: NADH-quinone oxidoreductase subunit L [Gemmatimonadota bacterium]|nr:NADH-quinone oxidoreductase subunit L [Gemmatimonadota bacterium]
MTFSVLAGLAPLLAQATGGAEAAAPASSGGVVSAIGMAVLLPFLGFLVNGALALWRPDAKRIVSMVGPAVLVGSFVIAILVFLEVRSAPHAGPILVHYWDWMTVGTLELALQFQVDQLSVVMMLVITGIGSLIHIFSVGYMRADPGYARYFSYLNLFVAFMLILVLGSNLPVLFIGWEGVGLCSYLLIGFWYQDKANADAGKKAFIVNRIGDFGVLVAMFTLWWSLGTLEFSEIAELAPTGLVVGGGIVTLITMALFVGCTGKSAQIPLYTWLPDAMAGPTPVSALIHAATMVTAGVYLVARTSVLFAMAPTTSMVVAGIGALTAVFAATIGLRQYDIKKVLAYSTVSQLGYMFLAVGTGAYVAGVFHLVTHAFFKALLFLGSGSVIHAMHHALHATHSPADPQDMRNMGGLKRYLPWTYGLMMIATLAIAGIPIFSGFFSKDEILAFAFSRAAEAPIWYLFWGMGLAAALMTAFYMARLMSMTFLGQNRTGQAEQEHLHEAPWIMTGPLLVLGVLSLAGGLLNLPGFIPGLPHHLLDTWLEPVLEPALRFAALDLPHGATEAMLIAGAVFIAVAGLAWGFRSTGRAALVAAGEAPDERGLWRVIYHKYYIDELYHAVVVRPLVGLSRIVLWKGVDKGLIDGLMVHGSAATARGLGWLGSRLQTGQVGVYVLTFLLGAVWLLRAMTR